MLSVTPKRRSRTLALPMRKESLLNMSSMPMVMPSESAPDCNVITEKIDFLLKVNRIAVGVDQIEPLLDDLLTRISASPKCRPVVSAHMQELVEHIDYNNIVVVAYC